MLSLFSAKILAVVKDIQHMPFFLKKQRLKKFRYGVPIAKPAFFFSDASKNIYIIRKYFWKYIQDLCFSLFTSSHQMNKTVVIHHSNLKYKSSQSVISYHPTKPNLHSEISYFSYVGHSAADSQASPVFICTLSLKPVYKLLLRELTL